MTTARRPRPLRTIILSMLARGTLTLVYALTVLVCRVTPASRRWGAGLPARIAVTGTFYNPGWFQAHMAPLIRSGVREVTVVSDRPLQELAGVCFSCPPPWLRHLTGRAVAKFVWLLVVAIRHRPDVFIGYHIFPGAVTALIAARLFKRPACYQMTGGPLEVLGGGWHAENPVMGALASPSPLIERLAIAVIRRFDLVVVRGSKAKAFLMDRGVDRVAVITGSVITPIDVPAPAREYDLLFVGRLAAIKQPLQFVDTVARVRRRRPAVRAAVVGNGPLLDAARERAALLGIGESIEFLGHSDDIGGILARARLFILTSRSEGLSIAMAEAMAAGVVPIVADVGDLSDFVVDGVTGFLVTPNDVDEFSRRAALLLENEELWARQSQAAAAAAGQHAGLEAVTRKWALGLAELVPGHAHSPTTAEPGL